jgi:hypothetical protein
MLRRSILSSLLLLAAFTTAYADVLLFTEFGTAATPTGWTLGRNVGTQNMVIRNSPAFGSTSGSFYLAFDDPGFGTIASHNDAWFSSPVFSTVGRTQVQLQFTHFWDAVEFTHGLIEYSIDGGTTWSTKEDYSVISQGTSAAAPTTTILDMSAELAGRSNVRIRFRYNPGT